MNIKGEEYPDHSQVFYHRLHETRPPERQAWYVLVPSGRWYIITRSGGEYNHGRATNPDDLYRLSAEGALLPVPAKHLSQDVDVASATPGELLKIIADMEKKQ